MNESVHHQIGIFAHALALPVEERAAYVARACSHNNQLREEISELLDANADAAAAEFLNSPPALLVPNLASRSRESIDLSGVRIDRYRLIEKLGEGGAGVVYLAEQEEPVRRPVALKLVKAGADTPDAIARFVAERQALAVMEHPNIARVFDAGASSCGRLYSAMELVRGPRITDYCDDNSLTIAERLALVVPVCRAVHHAHSKGIVHRDLKPSNILVTVHDGVPVPKVIDFGIAKEIRPPGSSRNDPGVPPAGEVWLGTPNYLSPEQVGTETQLTDHRSDVYSLGVLLYELLTGVTPLDIRGVATINLLDLRRRFRDEEPASPSVRLASLEPDELRERARRRSTTPEQMLRELRGPLDLLVMHCLEKDARRRYPTAASLAGALQSWLQGSLISKAPSGLLHPIRSFAQNQTGICGPAHINRTRAPTDNQAAFASYLRGLRLAGRSYNRDDVTGAVASFEEATTLDPKFALAWAHLSMAHGAMYWFTFLDPTTNRLARCKSAVDEALRLQPDLAEAHLALGVYYYRGFRDWENARCQLEIARQNLPENTLAACYLGLAERRMGDWKSSTAHLEEAVALDPSNCTAWGGLIDNHCFHRRYRDALDACERAFKFASDDRLSRRAQCWSRFALDGDRSALFNQLEACVAAPPDDARDRSELALLQGNLDEAARVLASSPARSFRDHKNEIAKAEMQALIAHLQGDTRASHRFSEVAASFYANSMLHREPEEAFNLVAMARTLALQGRKEQALDFAGRAMARLPVSRDALWGPEMIFENATLRLLVGEPDAALAHLEMVLQLRFDLSAHELRLHPLWRRLAGYSKFEAMLATIGPIQ